MNNKIGQMWEEVVTDYFKVLPLYFS